MLRLHAGKTWSVVLSLLLIMALCATQPVLAEDGAGDRYIYGDWNDNQEHVISEGGVYVIGEGATGILTIDTTDPVTLVGQGVEEEQVFEDLFITCAQPGTRLTLQDVGITDFENTANTIGFTGRDNILQIEGTCLLDYDFGYTQRRDALIHVPFEGSLTICGTGTLYQYNCTQGAGIGGNTGELNGDITFDLEGYAFIKGTKQGAVIGAGANAKSPDKVPGVITFLQGTYNLETNSRGAAIGGSAGSGGASSGTEVYVKGGSININCDFTGSAVGGGGYQSGNDSSGGTVYITGGSLRTYIDKNAASNEHGGFNNALFTEGINDAVITAQRLNDQGETVYKCVFDTTECGEGPYEVKIDGKDFFRGGRHAWAFINESLSKYEDEQVQVTRTQDNWIASDESNLYFYLTGTDHTITVGDRTYTAVFDRNVLDEEGNIVDSRVYTTGAFSILPASDAQPEFRTHSILLSGTIGVNFYMDLPGDVSEYQDSYVEFEIHGATQRAYFDPEKKNEDGGYYGFTCYIDSVSMADEIRAVFYRSETADAVTEDCYSVAQYVNTFQNHESLFDPETVDLIHALADYGHYIQPFLAESTGWIIGKEHAEMPGFTETYDIDAIRDAVSEYAIRREMGTSDLETITFSLLLDSETSVYLYLKPEDGYADTPAVTVDGKAGKAVRQADGRYRVAIRNISAHRLGEQKTVLAVTDHGTASVTVSPLSYVCSLLNSSVYSNNQSAQNAMAALYKYFEAANALKKA